MVYALGGDFALPYQFFDNSNRARGGIFIENRIVCDEDNVHAGFNCGTDSGFKAVMVGNRPHLHTVRDYNAIVIELLAQEAGKDRLRESCREFRVEICVIDVGGHYHIR